MAWWWLSFADPERPKGTQFLGASYVEGRDVAHAALNAWAHGCNPGGEVCGFELPDGFSPDEDDRNRLMPDEEIERRWGAAKSEQPPSVGGDKPMKIETRGNRSLIHLIVDDDGNVVATYASRADAERQLRDLTGTDERTEAQKASDRDMAAFRGAREWDRQHGGY